MKYAPGWEFYDLRKDPHEDHNAINDPRYKTIIKDLKKRLHEIKNESGDGIEKNETIKELIEKYW